MRLGYLSYLLPTPVPPSLKHRQSVQELTPNGDNLFQQRPLPFLTRPAITRGEHSLDEYLIRPVLL